MANDYMNLSKIAVVPQIAVLPAISVFPAQAGNQCCYEVQSSTNAQLDTRLRGYDEIEIPVCEYDGAKAQHRTKQVESK